MTAPTITRPTYCPEWCVVPAEQHEAEFEQWEGGSVHWSTSFGTLDGEEIKVGAATDVDGRDCDPSKPVTIHVGPDEFSPEEAQAVALGFFAAVSTVRTGEVPAKFRART